MAQKKHLFLTGGTGYIGGSVLTALVETGRYDIVALIREE